METRAEESSFRAVYEAYRPEIVAYFLRRCHPDDAQDLAEEVFTVAWRRRLDVPADREALMWLYGVAHNTLSHYRRSTGRRIRLEHRLATVPGADPPGPETEALRRVECEQVLEVVNHLKVKDQEVLRLALWEGLTHREIAQVTGASVPAVKQRFHRAKRRLAREYERLTSRIPAATPKGGGVR